MTKAQDTLSEATTDAEREVATNRLSERVAKLEAVRNELTDVLADTAGQPTETARQASRPVPTTFKRGSRHYGHRALRINADDVEPAARANVLSDYDRYSDLPAES